MAGIQLDLSTHRMLLVDWFTRLGREAGMDFQQRSGDEQVFTIGSPAGFHVLAHALDARPFLKFVASDSTRQGETDDIATAAVNRVEAGDFGGVVWYSDAMVEPGIKYSPFSLMGGFFQRLGGQQRILGWRRLGGGILLEFIEAPETGQGSPFAPQATVHVHIPAPGPCEGHLSSHLANSVVETVAAICTFALGRPVDFSPAIFPTKNEVLPELNERRADPAVYTLARKSVSLDILSLAGVRGGFQVFQRARAAFLTFDAAVRQERDPIAAILYVAAAECLTSPPTEWRREKLTKRFISFFEELIPEDIDQIVAHGNFEEAFAVKRGSRTARALRKATLDSIYSYRSGQVHEGITPRSQPFGLVLDSSGFTRRGLLLSFAESAIVRYLTAPRSTLVGHPAFEAEAPEQPAPSSRNAARQLLSEVINVLRRRHPT